MNLAAQRFLRLIAHNTQSNYESTTYPSTPEQTVFAKLLVEECKSIGLSDVAVDGYGYVTATLPANTEVKSPVIGLLAHMDTSPDSPGKEVKPRMIKNYDGGNIELNQERTLSLEDFPSLKDYTGQDLIVTSGDTLLGADDKAGIAEILTAMEHLLQHPEIKHGKIRIAFTPDEEVGRGVDYFDVHAFGADFAYTVDGGALGELEFETFNAARVNFHIKGKSVHPGMAYHAMINAALLATEIANAFPKKETPAETRHRDGFYHLIAMNGEVNEASLSYILRDFDAEGLQQRKAFAEDLTEQFNKKYGAGTVTLEIRDEYRNMAEVLRDRPDILDRAKRAMEKAHINPVIMPIRGGTDGSRLSFMGLPCPNIFTGGHNFHGPFEYIPVSSMEAAVRVIINICEVD